MASRKTRRRFLTAFVLAGVTLWLLGGLAYSASSFYEGKTITLIQGRRPGGLGDMRARALMPFLTKHLPGNPTIVSEFMPGAGGRKLANHLYKAARPDGLTIGNIGSGFVANAVLGEPGVQYDIDKLIYLGSGNSKTSYVFLTRKPAGLNSTEKLKAASGLRVGALSVGHDIYINARLFVWLVGVPEPAFITGYSGPELDLALLRGEVDARTTTPTNLVQRNPDWLKKDLMDYHAILEIPKGYRFRQPPFDSLPTLESFSQNERQRRVLAMFRTFRLVGSPYILPPRTPGDRVEILEQAFRKALNDPALPQAWKKLTGEEPAPLMPEEQQEAIKTLPRDRETIELFQKIAGAGPLPSR